MVCGLQALLRLFSSSRDFEGRALHLVSLSASPSQELFLYLAERGASPTEDDEKLGTPLTLALSRDVSLGLRLWKLLGSVDHTEPAGLCRLSGSAPQQSLRCYKP